MPETPITGVTDIGLHLLCAWTLSQSWLQELAHPASSHSLSSIQAVGIAG